MDKLDMKTENITQGNIEKIRQLFPNAVTEVIKDGKVELAIDFDVLKQELSESLIDEGKERYQMTWPGKRQAVVLANTSTTDTLRPCKEESVDFDNTQNLYIEGDNLNVLKLLRETYLGKIKMIYIDPPYNTGNDFIYNDDFAMESGEWRTDSGNFDEQGNRLVKNLESNGRFHTDWLNMLYPRLRLARDLLTDDGVIFISIDDNEQANLNKICDETFGESNFIAQIVWERAYSPVNLKKHFSESHDYIICYAKNLDNTVCNGLPRSDEANERYSNPDNDPRGVWKSADCSVGPVVNEKVYEITLPSGRKVLPATGRCWVYTKERFDEMVKDNRIWFGPNGDNTPRLKRFLSELKYDGMAPTSLLFYKDVGHSQEGAQEVVSLFGDKGVFDGPKPVRLLERLIILANLKSDSIVLDFFSGSATTAHALMKMNSNKNFQCKFILVQLPEEVNDTKKEQEYKNICEIGKERIRRAGKNDTGFRVFRLADSNFEEVKKAPAEYDQAQLDLFLNNVKSDRTDLDLLFGAMLSWGVQLSLPMASEEVDGKMIYSVNDGDLVACFADDITENIVKVMADKQPLRVLFRDSCFARDDAKINVFETLKQLLDWSEEDAMNNIKVI